MDSPRNRLRVVPLRDPVVQAHHLKSTTTAAERLEMMWPLALEAWAFKGEPVVEQRLPRHIVHVYCRTR
jgi:hypothetical protein